MGGEADTKECWKTMTDRRPLNTDIEKRWFVWHCRRTTEEKKRFVARVKNHPKHGRTVVKDPCGKWNATATRKWAASKTESRWQVVCRHCGRKRAMNLGMCLPEDGMGYQGREQAEAEAKRMNEQEEHRRAIESQHIDSVEALL